MIALTKGLSQYAMDLGDISYHDFEHVRIMACFPVFEVVHTLQCVSGA